MLLRNCAKRLLSEIGNFTAASLLEPDDDAGDGEHDGQEFERTDKDAVGQTEDVGLMQGDEPVGDRVGRYWHRKRLS